MHHKLAIITLLAGVWLSDAETQNEEKTFSDPALNAGLAACTKQVAELPENTVRKEQKKAALMLALERTRNTAEAGLFDQAKKLLQETSAAVARPVDTHPRKKLNQTLHPPLKTTENNPYLEALYTWAEKQLQNPDIEFKKATHSFNPFTGLYHNYGTREEAANMNRYYWLATHPESRYCGNAELITRLLRRVHAYADAHQIHGNNYRDRTNDFFAIGPVVEAMLKTRTTFPDLLLPGDKESWDAMIKKTNSFWFNEVYKTSQTGAFRMGRYANRDLGVANILLACGLYLQDEESIQAARTLVMDQFDNLYPDGAIAYIGTQNESCGYHGADIMLLTRYYHLSGQTEVLDLLKKCEWYAPLSVEPGNVSDFWTAPSWKHTWNTSVGFSGETVAALTGNPYERGLLDRNIAKRGAEADPRSAMWYDSDIQAAPLPDNYAIFDRNIQGPRGRFDRFSYAATLRVPNNDEPGTATLMGAMTIEKEKENFAYPLEAMLANIMPKVFTATTPEDIHKRPDWASLACRNRSAVSMGRDWSAFQSRYQLHTFGSSRKGTEVPWEGTQIWLNIRDRLFGLLEVAPMGEQEAHEVAMAATLGVGGCGEVRPKDLKTHSRHHWSLGSLNLKIIKNNFESIRVEETKIRTSNASQIICSTRPDDEPISEREKTTLATSKLTTFDPENPFYAVVEISPGEEMPDARVKRIDQGDFIGLHVQLETESYTLLLNCGDKPHTASLSPFGLKPGSAWVHYPRSAEKEPEPVTEPKVQIPAGEHRVFVSGSEQQMGWPHFEAMIRELEGSE